jgi:metal-dependent HD superfamily phosphatase/phosphodiesterase
MSETVGIVTRPLHILTRDVLSSVKGNSLTQRVLQAVEGDKELQTLWQITNVHAIKRMGITDHGPAHFRIVAQRC